MDLTRTIVFAAALLMFMLSLGYVFASDTPPAGAELKNTPPSKEVHKARDKAAADRAFRARAAPKPRATASRRFTT
jgi:hypothetical protein